MVQSPEQEVALQGRGTFTPSGVTRWDQEPKGAIQWDYNFGVGDEVVPT
mgnify:CR=1 FL=1